MSNTPAPSLAGLFTEMPTPGSVLSVRSLFDPKFYLATNADVAEAGLDPYQHYERSGATEGRRPVPWFDPIWYAHSLGLSDRLGQAFRHYCAIGNILALAPNPMARAAYETAAQDIFDADYYLRQYPDIAAAGLDPWLHFLNFGAREGRNPSAGFATSWYLAAQIAPELPADTDISPCNPLVHYRVIGRFLGFDTAPQPDDFDDDLTELEPSAQPVVAAPTETPPEDPPAVPVATVPPVMDAVDLLISHMARRRQQARGADSATADLTAEEALIYRSAYFNTMYYRGVSGIHGSRKELVRHYISEGAKSGFSPSAEFSVGFYRDRYETLPKALTDFACAKDQNAFVHFLTIGQAKGFYPNPQIASLEIERIRASGMFDQDFYFDRLGRRPFVPDLVADYAFFGHLEGADPNGGFDSGLVRRLYSALCDMPMHAPLAFCVEHADRPWLFHSAHDLMLAAEAVRNCPLFDADFYRAANDLDGTDVDAALHYVTVGLKEALAAGPEFDTEFYLANNPDLAAVRVNALLHYRDHGRAEGRMGKPQTDERPDLVRQSFDPARPSVLIFTHEASRTGAPIVALNVARKLSERYNVIVWSGKLDGALLPDFGAVCMALYTGWGSVSAMARVFETLRMQHPGLGAIVNSVVCNPVIAPLRLAGIPIVSLLHEFANYVYPFGTLGRMVLNSDIAVFPARMVQDACTEELTQMGSAVMPANLRIRPQGYNGSQARASALTADLVRKQIGIDGTNPRQKVLFGAGQVQPRKGVDLFLQAAHCLQAKGDYDWRFVWVGGGYDPQKDMTTSVYLQHQIRESGLADRLTMFGEQSSLEPFWQVADVFFMSSRMDPFPNVALDALERRLPLVCFAGGTGIADLEPNFPFAVRAVPFADATAAAQAITGFVNDRAATEKAFAGKPGKALMQALSFDSYVADLETYMQDALAHHGQVQDLAKAMAAVPRSVMDRALAAVPALFHLTPVRSERLGRVNLAALMIDRPLTLNLNLEPGSGMLEDVPPPQGLCDARYGRAPGRMPPRDHVLHLHLADPSVLDALLAPKSWTSRVMGTVRVVITLSDRRAAGAIMANATPNVEVVDDSFTDGFAALEGVLERTASAIGKKSGWGARTLTHCDITGGTIPPEVLDTLACLTSGSALECLEARPDVAGVIPQMLRGGVSAKVSAAFRQASGTADLPAQYAPDFNGTFRRDRLSDFVARKSKVVAQVSLGLGASDAVTVAALLHASDCAGRDEAVLLQALRLH